jgi:predicted PurR-regulated permease PerM
MALLPEPTRELIQNGTDQASTAVRGHLLLLVQSAAAVAIAGALGVLNTLGFIIALLGVPTWLFAVMTDQRRGVRLFNNMFPREARTDVWAVLRILDRTFSSWIRGQLGLAVLVGMGVFFGLWALEQLGIASIKYRLVLAVIATIMQLIPAVGPILGALPAVVAGFTQSREAGVAILLLYAGIQWLLGSIVAPQFQRRGPDMHPAIMVVILVLLAPFGFFWILVAAPLAIGARDLFRYAYGRLGDPPRPAGLLPGETVPVAPVRPRWR